MTISIKVLESEEKQWSLVNDVNGQWSFQNRGNAPRIEMHKLHCALSGRRHRNDTLVSLEIQVPCQEIRRAPAGLRRAQRRKRIRPFLSTAFSFAKTATFVNLRA